MTIYIPDNLCPLNVFIHVLLIYGIADGGNGLNHVHPESCREQHLKMLMGELTNEV